MPDNYLSEDEVQDIVRTDNTVQSGIRSILGIEETSECIFIHEDPYINGITADFSLIVDGKIKALIECKSGRINVTDYVRGIGQLLQYEFFCEEKIPHRSMEYEEDFSTLYLFPSSVLRINSFNVGLFKYPNSLKIVELNDKNNVVREISKSELNKIRQEDDNLMAISPYYFRDNRLFEYYILLNHLLIKKSMGYEECDRKKIEEELQKIKTINNNNWRNTFITVSTLGLIDKKNLPTVAGSRLAVLEYDEFAYEMYKAYLKPYVDEIYNVFEGEQVVISNKELCDKIRKNYNGKDIMYLTQSDGRYISSWLNIMRDDYGMIEFRPKSAERKIMYKPSELNERGFKQRIRKYCKAYEYIGKYQELLREGDL